MPTVTRGFKLGVNGWSPLVPNYDSATMVGRAGVTAAVAKRVPTRSRRSRWARVGAYPRTDDPRRDGKLAAFVLHMTTRTKLVFGSIEQYVWGVRAWMQSRRRPPDGCALLDVVIKVSSYQGAHLGAIIDLVEAKYCTTSLRCRWCSLSWCSTLLLLLPYRVPVSQDVCRARVLRQ